MLSDEPEPLPGAKSRESKCRYESELNEHIAREFQAYLQYYQLAADLARLDSPCSSSAPFFLRLADSTRVDIGLAVDVLLAQGGSLRLQQLAKPCSNLAADELGGVSLRAALEACLQLEDSKERQGFHEFARATGDVEVQKLADRLLLDSRRLHQFLTRRLSSDAPCSYISQELP